MTTPIRVGGDFVTRVLRMAYESGGMDEVVDLAAKSGMNATAKELKAICEGEARLEGNSVDGFGLMFERDDER